LTARDTLTGLAKARFDNQLFKTNKALLEFADQVAQDDLLPTRLPDKVKKPKWAKPRKPHGKASGRSFTGAEAAEMAADKAEKSSKMPDRRPTREDSHLRTFPVKTPRYETQVDIRGFSDLCHAYSRLHKTGQRPFVFFFIIPKVQFKNLFLYNGSFSRVIEALFSVVGQDWQQRCL
jgi:hypothetical protein